MKLRILSVLAFAAMAAVLLSLIVRHSLFAHSILGVSLQIGALFLMIWARITFGQRSFHAAANTTAGDMVTHGPYRYFRHPIYAAILFFVAATMLDHFTPLNGLLLSVTIAAAFTRAWCEESFLRERYPEYANYAKRTRRFLPFIL